MGYHIEYLFFMPDMRHSPTIYCFLLTLMACAKQGFPPGGPVDKAPSQVISTYPSAGATGVDVSTPVIIGFNEWMEQKSLKESIFISPIPEIPPALKGPAKLGRNVTLGRAKNRLGDGKSRVSLVIPDRFGHPLDDGDPDYKGGADARRATSSSRRHAGPYTRNRSAA